MSGENPFAVTGDSGRDRSGFDDQGVQVSSRTLQVMAQTRPWVLLLGVLAWIGTAFLILGGLVGMGAAAFGGVGGGEAVIMLVAYGFMGVIYGLLAWYLTSYAGQIRRLTESEQVSDLENALEVQKNFWRMMGILAVVMIAIYVVAIVVMIVGFAVMASAR